MNPAPAEANVTNVSASQPESLSLGELNEILGKNFKDKATALSSIREINSYTGKRKEDFFQEWSQAHNTDGISKEIRQLKENMFYKDHPELAEHRALIARLGDNPEDVMNMPEFKAIHEQASGYKKSQDLKTVLTSNPRLQESKDSLSKARDAAMAGNADERDALAARAVLATLED